MTDEDSAAAEEEVPPWQPPGWSVPPADPSVPPYAAGPGWQPPAAPYPPGPHPAPPGGQSSPYAPSLPPPPAPVPASDPTAAGWHGAGPGTVSVPPAGTMPPVATYQAAHSLNTPPYPPPDAGGYPQQPTVGGYPQPSGYQPSGYQPYGGYPKPGDTNGFAIASLVCSVIGIILVVVGPALGIVFGILALRQIGRRPQSGRGLAVAGLIIGGIVLVLDVLGLIGLAAGSSSSGGGLSTLPAISAALVGR